MIFQACEREWVKIANKFPFMADNMCVENCFAVFIFHSVKVSARILSIFKVVFAINLVISMLSFN